MVSQVAWPQSVQSTSGVDYVAGNGRRLVTFTVAVTQPTDDSGLLNAPTGVSAALKVGSASLPVSMTRINQEIAGGTSGSAETTGTDSFVASVPPSRTMWISSLPRTASASRSISGRSNACRRVRPSSIGTRRPRSVTGTPSTPFHLSLHQPGRRLHIDATMHRSPAQRSATSLRANRFRRRRAPMRRI